MWKLTVLASAGWFVATSVYADQFHYNNILMGDRAAGLGGAFGAVADDASGIHYNPAGIAFALSNDISGSGNAIYQRKVTYKKAAFGKDFVEDSSGSVAPFFGGLGKLDHINPGLVFAFGYLTLDSDLKDQDTLIQQDQVQRYHRTANLRANTNKITAGVAKRWGKLSVGVGLGYLWVDELAQVYQDSTSVQVGYNLPEDENDTRTERTDCCVRNLNLNTRERLQVGGVEPVVGVQYAISEKFALGLTLKKAFLTWQRYENSSEQSVQFYDANNKVVDKADVGIDDPTPHRAAPDQIVESNPMGNWPMEARFALAWFASPTALVTADVMYYTGTDGKVNAYDRDAVINYALGGEFYVAPSWPVRLGLFTNNDARPKPKSGKTDQQDSIDYRGISLFLAFAQPNSQIAVGGVIQQGVGKAQKVGDSTEIQDVEALALSANVSVSHNF